MYGKLCMAGDEEKAIQIAQQKLEQCGREGKTKPSEMCPGTTVHRLVEEIKRKVRTEKNSISDSTNEKEIKSDGKGKEVDKK